MFSKETDMQRQYLKRTLRPDRGRGVTAAQQIFNLHGGGSNPTVLTDTARSFNGSGHRSDKAETKVRFLLGLLDGNKQRRTEMSRQRLKQIHRTNSGVVV
jgi:hypothetical protein